MKKLTKLLTRFTIFSATACAILFGLPALATRHPFILQSELSRLELNGACSYDGKPIIRPSAENEEDACDWSAPDGLTPNGEYDLERRYYY